VPFEFMLLAQMADSISKMVKYLLMGLYSKQELSEMTISGTCKKERTISQFPQDLLFAIIGLF